MHDTARYISTYVYNIYMHNMHTQMESLRSQTLYTHIYIYIHIYIYTEIFAHTHTRVYYMHTPVAIHAIVTIKQQNKLHAAVTHFMSFEFAMRLFLRIAWANVALVHYAPTTCQTSNWANSDSHRSVASCHAGMKPSKNFSRDSKHTPNLTGVDGFSE